MRKILKNWPKKINRILIFFRKNKNRDTIEKIKRAIIF